jgi:hypothetical protein
MPPIAFSKRSESAIRFDKELGRCFGWACFSKKNGEPYIDLHGDHFPDDELLKAVDGLMKLPIEKREINVEHAGAARGTIVSAFALTEDIAKAVTPPIETGGTYGVLVSFEPDADLLKSIQAGEMICLSIEGKAYDVQEVAKSAAAEVAATAHKRTMRRVELTKLAVVKAGAHEGAQVAILKSAAPTDAVVSFARTAPAVALAVPVEKRQHAATSAEYGHQHVVYDVDDPDAKVGGTSWESMDGGCHGHSHSWVRNADGTITLLMAEGHTHTLATESDVMNTAATDLAKAQNDITNLKDGFAKRESFLKTILAAAVLMTPAEAAFAKRLTPDQLEGFLGKSSEERAKLATPIHKSERTGRVYYAGQEDLVAEVKDADAMHEKVEKAERERDVATFEKRADAEIPSLKGTTAQRAKLLKAIAGIADEADRTAITEALVGASQAQATLLKRVGHNNPNPLGESPQARYQAGLEAFAKSQNTTVIKATSAFNGTTEGAALYDAAYGPSR